MKHLKKLAGLALALVMLMALTVPALAVDDGQIMIDNALPGKEYKVYRIFDLENFNAENGNYAYKVNESWKAFIETDQAKAYVTVNEEGYVTWNEGADAAGFAALANTYITTAGLQPVASQTARAAVGDEQTVQVNITGLPLGYYLVQSSAGSLCSLDTTNKVAKITEKNGKPTVDKEVLENSNKEWGEKNDASIGDTVNFRSTVTIISGGTVKDAAGKDVPRNRDYKLVDTMSAGLTFDQGSVKVYLSGSTTEIPSAGNWSVINQTAQGFTVVFDNSWTDTLADGTQILVEYTAKLNENAVIAGEGNTNTARLDWNNDSTPDHSEDSTTRTYTYEFDLVKTNASNVLIPGAEFKLFRKGTAVDANGNWIESAEEIVQKYTVTKNESTSNGNWTVYMMSETGDKEVIAVENGKVIIRGLDAGVYYLRETKAPDGYNALKDDIKVEIKQGAIAQDGTVTPELYVGDPGVKVGGTVATINGGVNEDKTYAPGTTENPNGGVQVVNNNGVELPTTGGIGTTIFYVVGGVLIAAAAILLITKRRMKLNED